MKVVMNPNPRPLTDAEMEAETHFLDDPRSWIQQLVDEAHAIATRDKK